MLHYAEEYHTILVVHVLSIYAFIQKELTFFMADLWRQMLGNLSLEEKKQLVANLDINQSTVQRWINGESTPRDGHHIRALATLVPAMDAAMRAAFPDAFELPDDTNLEIPAFYAVSVNRMRAATASFIRQYTIHTHVFEYMVSQIDPNKQGLMLLFAQCVDPGDPSLDVTTLQVLPGHGSNMWRVNQIERSFLLGAGTRTGMAVSMGQPVFSTPDQPIQKEAPLFYKDRIQSAGAFPVKLGGDMVAGALFVASVYEDFFSPTRRELIEDYANMFALGLRDTQFYHHDRIQLRAIPSPQHQSILLQDFHQYMQILKRENPAYQDLTLQELEQVAIKKLRDECVVLRKEGKK